MGRLFRAWKRGVSLTVMLAAVLGIAAALAFMLLAFICTFLIWIGLPVLADEVFPEDVSIEQVIFVWKASAILWVPLALHWSWPHLLDMLAEWDRDDYLGAFAQMPEFAREVAGEELSVKLDRQREDGERHLRQLRECKRLTDEKNRS